MCIYIYIYIILQDIRSASKSLRLCRYLPYSRQQHGCPLVRIHLLSNFVGVAFPSQKIIENMTVLGQKVEEIRETRICPVVSRRKNMRCGAWFLNASHASFFTLEEASWRLLSYQCNCEELSLQAGWKRWRIWTHTFFLRPCSLNGIEKMWSEGDWR